MNDNILNSNTNVASSASAQRRIEANVVVEDSNPLVRQHRLNGRHILPGVALLDVLLRTLEAAGESAAAWRFLDVVFHAPVMTDEFTDRNLQVLVQVGESEGKAEIRSDGHRADPTNTGIETLHLSCRLARGSSVFPTLLETSNEREQDLDLCYRVTRKIGIQHDDFMKCSGKVWTTQNSHVIARIALSSSAAQRADDFFAHPVLLDCSTVVPLFGLRNETQDANLFIPFGIDEFYSSNKTAQNSIFVQIDPRPTVCFSQEVVRHSATLFSSKGEPLARFKNFTVKRVHAPASVGVQTFKSVTTRARLAGDILPGATGSFVRSVVKETLGLRCEQATLAGYENVPFFELGLDSRDLLELTEILEKRLKVDLYPTLLFEHNSSSKLVDFIEHAHPNLVSKETPRLVTGNVTRSLEQILARRIERITKISIDLDENRSTSFFELGLDSSMLLDVCVALSREMEEELYPTLLFEYSSLSALAKVLRLEHSDGVRRLSLSESISHKDNPKSETTANKPGGPQIALPRWVLSPPIEHESEDCDPSRVIALSSEGWLQYASGFVERLSSRPGCESTVFCVPDGIDVDAKLDREHLDTYDEIWCLGLDHSQVFELIKGMIRQDCFHKALRIHLVTVRAYGLRRTEQINAHAEHGVWGLLQSASRELEHLSVAQIDLSKPEDLLTCRLGSLRCRGKRTLRAIREDRSYQRQIVPSTHVGPSNTIWKENGVYLVIGGAGGVGLAWLENACRTHNIRVAVMGRRSMEQLPQMNKVMERLGSRVSYHVGDIQYKSQIETVLDEVHATHGQLNGIIHAAMVLEDEPLSSMTREVFDRVISPKVAGIDALGLALKQTDLDVLVVFSSLQSFVGNRSQANYAAASTYIDGKALALSRELDIPVRVINWGFWGDTGAVADPTHKALLARQGVHAMSTDDALTALDEALASGCRQVVIASLEPRVWQEIGGHFGQRIHTQGQPVLSAWPSNATENARKRFHEATKRNSIAEIAQSLHKLEEAAKSRLVSILAEIGIDPAAKETPLDKIPRDFDPLLAELLQAIGDTEQIDRMSKGEFESKTKILVHASPGLSPFARLLENCLSEYSEILLGRKNPIEGLFPGGSTQLVRKVYGGNPVSDFYNEQVAEYVSVIAETIGHQPRILEIGAGTGATTELILDKLTQKKIEVEYCFTELWDRLLEESRSRLAVQYPNMRFSYLDISANPRKQRIQDPYDIVVATNVLHATSDIARALQHIKVLLRPGGYLLLNESVRSQLFSTMTFGLLPGWWKATDKYDRLEGSPLLSRERWLTLLRDAGFFDIRSAVPAELASGVMGAQEVFVATSDGESRLVATPIESSDPIPPVRRVPARRVEASVPKNPSIGTSPLGPTQRPWLSRTTFECFELSRDARGHLWVRLNNPPANMFTQLMLEELCVLFEDLHAAAEEATRGVVYISHAGPYFSLGGDRTQISSWVKSGKRESLRKFAYHARRLLTALSTLPAIVIGVVNGSAQGGGFETLLATDLQVVGQDVKLSLPEVHSGLVPGMGGLTYLREQIGLPALKRLVFTGSSISADEAMELGLISHVAKNPELMAFEVAGQIAHLRAAISMKQRLSAETAEVLVADIDYWLEYLENRGTEVDHERIARSHEIIGSQSSSFYAANEREEF